MSADVDIILDEKIKVIEKEPSMYKVVFLNDEATPIDFVVSLLIELFKHSDKTAHDITIKIHEEGSGVVGIYTYEIAEQKGLEVTMSARSNNYPLQIKLEPETI